MKRFVFFSLILGIVLAGQAHAQAYLKGEIVSRVGDARLNLAAGDKVLVTIPSQSGVIVGDMLVISGADAPDPSYAIGKCAVIKVGKNVSECEIVQSRSELHQGDAVFMASPDPGRVKELYPTSLAVLRAVVEPYAPYKKVTIGILNIFDDKQNVTGLGESLKASMAYVFGQKPRVKLIPPAALRNVDFRPGDDGDALALLKAQMTNADVDVILTGSYRSVDGGMLAEMVIVRASGQDQVVGQMFPASPEVTRLAGEVVSPAGMRTAKKRVLCEFTAKPIAYSPVKEEKLALIRREGAGDPFIEAALKRTDFNIVSPVELMVRIDGQRTLQLGEKPQQMVALDPGPHRLVFSFKRGYFFNEVLLTTSPNELVKEVVVDTSKGSRVAIEVKANPMATAHPLDVRVFEPLDKERLIMRPIPAVDIERSVEYYKD